VKYDPVPFFPDEITVLVCQVQAPPFFFTRDEIQLFLSNDFWGS